MLPPDRDLAGAIAFVCRARRGLERFRDGLGDHESERKNQRTQDHRHAPAPLLQARGIEIAGNHEAHDSAEHACKSLAGILQRRVEPARFRRCRFQQIGRARAHLAAQREALHETCKHDQDWRGDADRGVRRRQRQNQNTEAHEHEAQHHCGRAAGAIGIGSYHDAAQRARREADTESRQRQKQAAERRVGRKEGLADLRGEEGLCR
jgi:hypothetical protein